MTYRRVAGGGSYIFGRACLLLLRCFAIGQFACPPLRDLVRVILGNCGRNIDGCLEFDGGFAGGAWFMFFDLTWRRG
jgi:hypothetical protein